MYKYRYAYSVEKQHRRFSTSFPVCLRRIDLSMHTTPTNRSANLGGNKTGIDTIPPPILVLIPTNLHIANFLPLPFPLCLPLQLSLSLSPRNLLYANEYTLALWVSQAAQTETRPKQSKASEAKRGKASKAIYTPKEKQLVCRQVHAQQNAVKVCTLTHSHVHTRT
jgi:hypothetical protein